MSKLFRKIISLNARSWLLIGFLCCVGMEMSAIYFQFVLGLEPCPLCITQRLVVLTLGLVFLTGTLHHPKSSGMRLYFAFAALVSVVGAGIGAYHFLIQILPHDEISSCGPGASYILQHFSLAEGIKLFLTGTGDCTQVVWTFLGLSMPFWVALSFCCLASLCFWQFWQAASRRPDLAEELAAVEME